MAIGSNKERGSAFRVSVWGHVHFYLCRLWGRWVEGPTFLTKGSSRRVLPRLLCSL